MWQTDSDWYNHQREFDVKARLASESVLGVERGTFGTAMGQFANILDRAIEQAPHYDLATKRNIPLAVHAFNLLWSAWDAALAGRYDAAASYRRSIAEVSDLLMAIYVEPDFAEQMKGDTRDIKRARRIFRNALEKHTAGTGANWMKKRLDAAKGVQPFSHVSFEAISAGFGIGTQDGSKIGALRPGGVPSGPTLRVMACELASNALELLAVVAVALSNPQAEELRKQAIEMSTQLSSQLKSISIDVPDGEMKALFLLRSIEHAPNVVGVPGVKSL